MTQRTLPQIVQTGPRTADVLRLHRARPDGAAGQPRSSGTSALAAEPLQSPPRRLHAVPGAHEGEEARKVAAAITRATMEVLAGTRPVQQLAPWLHRDLLASVQLRADLSRAAREGSSGPSARAHRAASIRSSHARPVGPGLYEAAVVVADAVRCRAVALRLEAAGGSRWQVTALEIG
ncbi:Rv3235 family protein [Sinomonas soli]